MGFDEHDDHPGRSRGERWTDRQLSVVVYVLAATLGLATAWLFVMLLA